MPEKKPKNIESQCVHSGMKDNEHKAVVPPIYQTSTFKFDSAEHGASLFKDESKGYIYTRMGNPTIEAMENAVAELEGGCHALGCASGMAAISTTLIGLLNAGDHLICSKAVYGPTAMLIKNILNKFNISAAFVDASDVEQIKKSIQQNTKVIYVETPGNPTLEIADISAISLIANSINATLVVDNTFMSPVLQKPFRFGADIVLHSMTKFINGHADVVGGIIVFKEEETFKKFRKVLNQLGGVINPFEAFLVHRGIKTLALRMQRHCENAQAIAGWLEKHDKVKWVRYPGLKSHPQYKTGIKQHEGHGGMISFELAGGFKAGETTMNAVKFCQLAVSLGGVETLIQHPASMTHQTMGKEAREKAGITDGLVRLSVGIENVNDIIEDLENAMNQIAVLEEAVSL